MTGVAQPMPRTGLDTATIVAAAIRLADLYGVDELTMRQLAARLGVKAMALYRYVESRAALLDAMVAALLDQLATTMTRRARTGTTETTYLSDTAHDVRKIVVAHPWLIRLMVLRLPPAPWLSLPLSSLACTDTFLDALDRRGIDPATSVTTYRTFNAFLLSALLLQSTEAGHDPEVAQQQRGGPPLPAPPAQYPALASHPDLLAPAGLPAEFDRELHLFLQSVARDRAAHLTDLHHPQPRRGA